MTEVLAIDLGGTHLKWGVVRDGHVDGRGRIDTPTGGADAVRDALAAIVERVPAQRIGLCVAGWVDPAAGIVRHMSALGIHDWDVAAALPRGPAVIVNDLVAASAGEAAGSPGSLAVLAFGTGVAAGFIVDGRPWAGAEGLAGEVGHQTYRRGGRRCGCGRRGCIEAYAGWGGLRRAMARHGMSGGARQLAATASRQRTAQRLLDEALDAAGHAASLVVSTLDPGDLRIGGGLVAAWGEPLLAAVRSGIDTRCWHGERTRVAAARHGADTQLLGVARLAQEAA
jgi:glucokinase